MDSQATEKINRAKTKILLTHPWWATLLLNLRTVESDRVPTMATDGTYLIYNPQFTLSLSDRECQGVLLHEVAHCALLHCFRRAWRDPLMWNIAADAAANALLLADGIQLPKGCVPPAEMGKTAEEIYDELEKQVNNGKSRGQDRPQDVYGPGELGEAAGNQADQAGEATGKGRAGQDQMGEREWKDAIASARGLEPAGLTHTIDKSRESKKDWRQELAEFMHATKKADSHTWNRVSRRIAGAPGWKRTPETTIAVVVDTSGSIVGPQLNAFVAEAKAVAALEGMSAYLISCDAAVHQVIAPGEPWPEEILGGGGTDFRPALDKVRELQPDACLFFTDGEGAYPTDCQIPVLWALTKDYAVPFGKKIIVEAAR